MALLKNGFQQKSIGIFNKSFASMIPKKLD